MQCLTPKLASVGSVNCPRGRSIVKIHHKITTIPYEQVFRVLFVPFLCLLSSTEIAAFSESCCSTGFNHTSSSFCTKRAGSGSIKTANAREGEQSWYQKPRPCQVSALLPCLQLAHRTHLIPVAVCLTYSNSICARLHIKWNRKGLCVIIYIYIYRCSTNDAFMTKANILVPDHNSEMQRLAHTSNKSLTGNAALMSLPGITHSLMLMLSIDVQWNLSNSCLSINKDLKDLYLPLYHLIFYLYLWLCYDYTYTFKLHLSIQTNKSVEPTTLEYSKK